MASLVISCYSCRFGRRPLDTLFLFATLGLCLWHPYLGLHLATFFLNHSWAPAVCSHRMLALSYVASVLIGCSASDRLLLSSSVASLAISWYSCHFGRWPSATFFLITLGICLVFSSDACLLIGCFFRHLLHPLLSNATLVILEGGFRPPSYSFQVSTSNGCSGDRSTRVSCVQVMLPWYLELLCHRRNPSLCQQPKCCNGDGSTRVSCA